MSESDKIQSTATAEIAASGMSGLSAVSGA
jgi:hypothetical protein